MATTTRQENVTGSSQEIVATNTQSLLEQQNHSTVVISTGGRNSPRSSFIETVTGRRTSNELASSLMPRKTKLNEPLTKSIVEGLQQAAESAAAQASVKRARPDIPTADLVKRSGFKTGAKLLIKIVPSATSTPFEDGKNDVILDNFSLQGVAEPDEERYQLHETFESEVLFLFGRRPRVWTLQGIVLNGKREPESPGPETPEEQDKREKYNMDFANTLIQKWNDYFRGSKAIESRSKTYIGYEDQVIEGTLLAMTMVRNAQIPGAVNSTITFVVHQRTLLGQKAINDREVPELQQLVEEAQLNLPKTPPSDLNESKPNKDEIQRREDEARGSETSARETAERKKAEKNQLEKYIAERKKLLADNAANQQTQRGIVSANTVGDEEQTQEQIDAAIKASGEIQKLQREERKLQSELDKAELNLDKVNAELEAAVKAQEDATQKTNVTSSTTDNASGGVLTGGGLAAS